MISGLRICLGAPQTRADITLAMTRLHDALGRAQDRSSRSLI
jgi:hypothetical protein